MFAFLIYATVLVVATCGLVYQLLAGTVASYVLGDSITQFSVVIGVFLSALGTGAWLARSIDRMPARAFVETGLMASLVGGTSALVMFAAFSRSRFFRPVLYGELLAMGSLVGVQLPLVLRVLRRHVGTRALIARALTVDYAGALVGALTFALIVLPRMGAVRAGLAFGILHSLGSLLAIRAFGPLVGPPRDLWLKGAATVTVLSALLLMGGRIAVVAEDGMYPDPVILARHTPYQRIAFTSGRNSLQLFLDGNLQFASADERRYHEALVHPVMSVARAHTRVLVLGGGDGLALREILRYPDVARVTLVDLDPAITDLAQHFEPLRRLNEGSFSSPRVRLINDDAMVWLGNGTDVYDVVIVDFPDPNNFSLGKLYTTRFYALLSQRLAPDGVITVQSTSPWMARQSFWCVVRTLEAAGFRALPYHAFVPSFGEWGYVLAARRAINVPTRTLPNLHYLTDAVLPTLFVFSADMTPVPADVNRLNNQVLVQYYEREWRRFN